MGLALQRIGALNHAFAPDRFTTSCQPPTADRLEFTAQHRLIPIRLQLRGKGLRQFLRPIKPCLESPSTSSTWHRFDRPSLPSSYSSPPTTSGGSSRLVDAISLQPHALPVSPFPLHLPPLGQVRRLGFFSCFEAA